MLRELVIGTAVLGLGGLYFLPGAEDPDIVRTVNASPRQVWRSLDLALHRHSGQVTNIEDFEGVSHPTRTTVTSVDSKEIDLRVDRRGAQIAHVRIRFAPLANGAQTKMMIDADVDRAALPGRMPAFAGNTLFRKMIGKMADEVIPQIEQGRLLAGMEQIEMPVAEMRREMQSAAAPPPDASPRERERAREAAREAAARPMVDPDAAALDPKGASTEPGAGPSDY